MNETTPDAWFYSREGERLGPVTFEELKNKATEAGLNPRLDMVWTHGMPEWKPAGEIEGLFERRAAAEALEGQAPSSDPYRSPEHESPEELMSQEGDWPGTRRRSFLFAILVLPFLLSFGIATTTVLLQEQFGKETGEMILLGVVILAVVFVIYVSLQRLANLGMSRWWYLANIVPFLNLWVGYRSFACPAGYAYHKKLDTPGVLLAIVYWLGNLLVILGIGLAIGVLSGVIGSPEFRKVVIDAYHEGVERKSREIEDARHK
jgi:uncharacterized membrane protein YhaH (DUF805 family)